MRTLTTLLFVLSCCVFVSCEKTDRIQDDESEVDSQQQSVYEYIKKLGFEDHEIDDIGEEYVVDGDILFSKKIIPDFSVFNEGPKTKQYGSGYYVGYLRQPNVTVRIDPSMSAYSNEINGAIAMWNAVPNCRLKFTLTTASNQDILIVNANLGQDYCGGAYFPVNGRPGALVRINISEISGNSFLQRQRTIAHELGHTIGFRHTNWHIGANPESAQGVALDNGARINAVQILGTPTGSDVNSLMNRGQCGTGATSLSSYDIVATQFLYPANPPIPGTVPVFRYYKGYTPDKKKENHFFTTNISELGDGALGFAFEGIGFFAFPNNSVPGTIPVYRYYSVTEDDHFYTVTAGSYSSYAYEGIAFYAYPSAINGALPVYRYYSYIYRDHHYTKNPNETSMVDYFLESTEFYAY